MQLIRGRHCNDLPHSNHHQLQISLLGPGDVDGEKVSGEGPAPRPEEARNQKQDVVQPHPSPPQRSGQIHGASACFTNNKRVRNYKTFGGAQSTEKQWRAEHTPKCAADKTRVLWEKDTPPVSSKSTSGPAQGP